MNLSALKKITKEKKKRKGQGHGSGRVKTSGRGTKGQKARRKIPMRFEGGALSLIKRLPYRRGKGRNPGKNATPVIINVKVLELLPEKTEVTLTNLIKYKIVSEKDAKMYGVKILGDGLLTKAFSVSVPVSGGARKKIEKAGGSVLTNHA